MYSRLLSQAEALNSTIFGFDPRGVQDGCGGIPFGPLNVNEHYGARLDELAKRAEPYKAFYWEIEVIGGREVAKAIAPLYQKQMQAVADILDLRPYNADGLDDDLAELVRAMRRSLIGANGLPPAMKEAVREANAMPPSV